MVQAVVTAHRSEVDTVGAVGSLTITKGGATVHALIEADGLCKTFGKVQALAELSLTLPMGQPVAILGPNGAGKTTFIRMVATLLEPDRGTLRVQGRDVVRQPMAIRRMIGLAGQSAAVEEMMTGRENLVMVARLYGQSARSAKLSAARILRQMSLVEAADRQVRTYSGGMRRRLDLGASLVGEPRLLLLDEPTTGLDPGGRNEVWDAVRDMSAAGTDIVLTTQYLDEADHLASSIVIIDGGRVIAQGTPSELKSRVGADMVELHTVDVPTMERAAKVLCALGIAEPVTDPATRRCSVPAPAGSRLLPVVLRALDDAQVPVEDITLRRPTLDEVFLVLTADTAANAAASTEGDAA
jgi:ABC-2 type transport system ATP-binding protein